jgi:Holliday junction resolvasome RuvABC endonuclease subunit
VIILAIDQAYKHSGFSVFKDGEYVSHGSYVVDKNDNSEVRYEKFIENIKNLIEEYKPDLVVTEKAWLGPNAKVYSLISELIGIIRCYCFIKDIKFDTVQVTSYRAKLGVKNKKEAVQEFVMKSFPDIELKNDDESDAIALGFASGIIF